MHIFGVEHQGADGVREQNGVRGRPTTRPQAYVDVRGAALQTALTQDAEPTTPTESAGGAWGGDGVASPGVGR